MSIRTRRFLFYSLVLLFLILGPFIIFYSRGLRFDFDSFELVGTGGIYLVTLPQRVTISLDDESVKDQSSIFQKGTLITGLIPDTYSLAVEREGFHPWQKQVSIEAGGVAVLDSVILVPQAEAKAIGTLEGTRFVSAGNHTATESGGGVYLNGTLVYGHTIVSLTPDGNLLTRSTQTGNYYLANAATPEEVLNLTLTFNNLKETRLGLPGAVDLIKALPYPYNSERFIVSTERAIYTMDSKRLDIEQLTIQTNNFFVIDGNSVAWAEKDQIVNFNLPLRTRGIVDTTAAGFSPKNIVQISSLTSNRWLVLTDNGSLFLFSDGWQEIADNIREIMVSPDRAQVVIISRTNDISALGTDETISHLETLSSGIEKIAWFRTNAHLLVLSGSRLSFMEVSEIKPLYTVELSGAVTDFSYEENGKTVKYLSGGNLFQVPILN